MSKFSLISSVRFPLIFFLTLVSFFWLSGIEKPFDFYLSLFKTDNILKIDNIFKTNNIFKIDNIFKTDDIFKSGKVFQTDNSSPIDDISQTRYVFQRDSIFPANENNANRSVLFAQEPQNNQNTKKDPTRNPFLDEDSFLYEEIPFDRLTVKKAFGGGTFDVFPLSYPAGFSQENLPTKDAVEVQFILRPQERYEINWTAIEKIQTFGEVVLEEAKQRLAQKKYTQIPGYLEFLFSRKLRPRGLDEFYNEFLFIEAGELRKVNRWRDVLVNYQTLYERNPEYPELQNELGRLYNELLQNSFDLQDYESVRMLYKNFAELIPGHEMVAVWKDKIETEIQQSIEKGNELLKNNLFFDAETEFAKSVALDPNLPSVQANLERLHQEFPMLRVGVTSRSLKINRSVFDYRIEKLRNITDWGEKRVSRLLAFPLLEPSDDRMSNSYLSVFGTMSQENFGQRAVFELNRLNKIQFFDPYSHRVFPCSAADVQQSLDVFRRFAFSPTLLDESKNAIIVQNNIVQNNIVQNNIVQNNIVQNNINKNDTAQNLAEQTNSKNSADSKTNIDINSNTTNNIDSKTKISSENQASATQTANISDSESKHLNLIARQIPQMELLDNSRLIVNLPEKTFVPESAWEIPILSQELFDIATGKIKKNEDHSAAPSDAFDLELAKQINYPINGHFIPYKRRLPVNKPTLYRSAKEPMTFADGSAEIVQLVNLSCIDGSWNKSAPGKPSDSASSDSASSDLTLPFAGIEERYFDSTVSAIDALFQGKIDILDRVPPWEVNRFRNLSGYELVRYPTPTLYALVPNMNRSRPSERTFRRALMYATDRRRILDKLLSLETEGRLLSAPFCQNMLPGDTFGNAYDNSIPPRPYNPKLALALSLIVTSGLTEDINQKSKPIASGELTGEMNPNDDSSAKKTPQQLRAELENPLILAHPDTNISRLICLSIQKEWKQIGIDVELKTYTDTAEIGTGETVDFWYAELCIPEPARDLPYLFSENGLLHFENAYSILTVQRLRRAADVQEAQNALRQIHRWFYDETMILPLFQISEYFVLRTDKLESLQKTDSFYRNILESKPK